MRVIRLNKRERNAFLAGRRLAVLSTNGGSGYPVSVPVWYGWDGETLRIFSMGSAAKIERLQRDPRVSVLVSNVFGEPARWVALEGRVTINAAGGLPTAEDLLARYVDDLGSGIGRETLEVFRSVGPLLVELRLVPERIRTYGEIFDSVGRDDE
ncbi:MAG: pyridoxamine 5'-phosphate oxidase family protein [Candidatus Binatia bacterium]